MSSHLFASLLGMAMEPDPARKICITSQLNMSIVASAKKRTALGIAMMSFNGIK